MPQLPHHGPGSERERGTQKVGGFSHRPSVRQRGSDYQDEHRDAGILLLSKDWPDLALYIAQPANGLYGRQFGRHPERRVEAPLVTRPHLDLEPEWELRVEGIPKSSKDANLADVSQDR